jgi:hypothetical protein
MKSHRGASSGNQSQLFDVLSQHRPFSGRENANMLRQLKDRLQREPAIELLRKTLAGLMG